jgi:putative spermidine/putrescine transport system substrate-binding protein
MEREELKGALSRRNFMVKATLAGVSLVGFGALSSFLEACGAAPSATTKGINWAKATSLEGRPLSELVSAAKKEGFLNVIALPPNWANYGTMISTFQKKYGIKVNSFAPDDSSAQENNALSSLRGTSKEPDAVDVGPSFAVAGKKEGLYAPYKVATWDTIPDYMKDPDGYWYGDYYGVISFGTNLKYVSNPPKDWSDLEKPEYKGKVSIDGDPRTAADAFAAVWAAALAMGGSLDDITPGIDFFAHLKKIGNLVPTDNYPANIVNGTTPIAIKWDYLNLGYKYQWNGNPPYEVTIPPSGVLGGYYCQAISAYAATPAAARLWEEFIYSDEGQIIYLAGFAHPARYEDLVRRNKIPASLAAKLPPASAYAKAQFPTLAQTAKAAAVVQAQWGPKVLGA